MLLSEYIGVGHKDFNKYGVLDTFIELDANYYVNLFALKNTKIKQFEESYSKIEKHFSNIFKLLSNYIKTGESTFFKSALKMFNYPEVNELGIGVASGKYGKGLTSLTLRKEILNTAVNLIKEGINDPDLFLLVGLLVEGIGADYISDMICNIIIDDIKTYTKDINKKIFGKEDLKYNEIKKCYCYYIPKELLAEIPMPKFMFDIDSTIRLNDELRNYMNNEIDAIFSKASKQEKVKTLVNFLKKDNNYKTIINKVNNFDYMPYDFNDDIVGIDKLINIYLTFEKISFDKKEMSSMYLTIKICNAFKKMIEDDGIYDPFVGSSGKVKEKNCQNLFYIFSKKQFEDFNYDLSPECNKGRGPVDFKISLGNSDKCLIEAKLLSSNKYSHGINSQLIEYAKAENCQNLVYLIFNDIEDEEKEHKRLEEISNIANEKKLAGYNVEIVSVKVEKKLSASLI